MIGVRGALRYGDPRYADGFALEVRAIARARRELGLTNIKVMIPFCRTVEEGRRVLEAMAAHGLRQGAEGLEVYAMCEIPSNPDVAVAIAHRVAEVERRAGNGRRAGAA